MEWTRYYDVDKSGTLEANELMLCLLEVRMGGRDADDGVARLDRQSSPRRR